MREQGWSYAIIAGELNIRKIKPPNPRSIRWTTSSVRRAFQRYVND